MKSVLKKGYLLGLLLWIFLVIGIVSITNWLTINTKSDDSEQKVILHSLYLSGNVDDEVLIWTTSGMENLNVFNWLSVWWDVEWTYSTIGWGLNNKISSSAFWWGVWWWTNNEVRNWDNSVVGGGLSNKVAWGNSVVVWWSNNTSFEGWIVLWWSWNSAYNNWVVLGGYWNRANWENSLVLWSGSEWLANSFAWNSAPQSNMARINADSWVLVWTYNPIDGVSLVVNWPVKLGSGSNVPWAINLNSSWCIMIYDGEISHALGRSSKSVCGVASWCQFGRTFLQNWDIVTGYDVSYASSCNLHTIRVKCENWRLKEVQWLWHWDIYPYCYDVSTKNWPRERCDANGDWTTYYPHDFGNLVYVCARDRVCLIPSCDFNWDGECNIGDDNDYNKNNRCL